MAIIQQKLVSFVWNFRHANFETNQQEPTDYFTEMQEDSINLRLISI